MDQDEREFNKATLIKFESLSDAELVKNYYHYIPNYSSRPDLSQSETALILKKEFSDQIKTDIAGDLRAIKKHKEGQ